MILVRVSKNWAPSPGRLEGSWVWTLVIYRLLISLVVVSKLSAAVTVDTVDALMSTIDQATADSNADRTILIEDGTYRLKWPHLWIGRDGVTIAGKSGNRDAVVLKGQRGMNGGQIEFIFQVSADDVTIRDLTLEDVGSHAIIIHGEPPYDADRTTLSNLVIRDTFEQMVKVTPSNTDPALFYSEGGVLEDCLLEYTAGLGPQFYIGGIDAHGAKDWIVRRNVFRNIRSPSQSVAEHAVHFWSWSRGTLVENNLIINCDRGIGFGLSNSGHVGGIIRNNIIFHDAQNPGGFADVSIEALHSDGAQIYNNTVWQAHSNYFAAIKNFESQNVTIANNLVQLYPGTGHGLNDAIWVSNGTGIVLSNAISAPNANWFGSVATPAAIRVGQTGNFLHIRDASITQLIDQGTTNIAGLPNPFTDFDGHIRPQGKTIDIGADEFRTSDPAYGLRLDWSNGVVRTTWQVRAGDWYQLERSPDLATQSWSTSGSAISADSQSLDAMDFSPTAARGFYRLVTLP